MSSVQLIILYLDHREKKNIDFLCSVWNVNVCPILRKIFYPPSHVKENLQQQKKKNVVRHFSRVVKSILHYHVYNILFHYWQPKLWPIYTNVIFISTWVIEWLVFNAMWTICQLFHGKNKLHFNHDGDVHFVLAIYRPAHSGFYSASSLTQQPLSFHLKKWCWFWVNPSLLLVLNAAGFIIGEKQ